MRKGSLNWTFFIRHFMIYKCQQTYTDFSNFEVRTASLLFLLQGIQMIVVEGAIVILWYDTVKKSASVGTCSVLNYGIDQKDSMAGRYSTCRVLQMARMVLTFQWLPLSTEAKITLNTARSCPQTKINEKYNRESVALLLSHLERDITILIPYCYDPKLYTYHIYLLLLILSVYCWLCAYCSFCFSHGQISASDLKVVSRISQ